MTLAIDQWAEYAALAASLENRQARDVLSARHDERKLSIAAGMVDESRNGRRPNWSKKEDEILKRWMLHLPTAELARKLGRSAIAVGLRRRKLGLPSISSQSGLPAHVAGAMLGFDSGKEVARLVRYGEIPGRRTPLGNNRFAIDRNDLLRWAIRPESWIYFKPERVADPKIRRLSMLAKERWGDEWWTTDEVSKLHGISQAEVARHCREGKIPSVRPVGGTGSHRIRKSVALELPYWKLGGFSFWNKDTEAFCIVAAAIGYPHRRIDRMANWPMRRTSHRLQHLKQSGQLPEIVRGLGLQVRVRPDGLIWADWQDCADKFTGIPHAVVRLANGQSLTAEHRILLFNVMASWLEWFADPDDDTARKDIRRLRYSVAAKTETLREWVRKLDERGIRPFSLEV